MVRSLLHKNFLVAMLIASLSFVATDLRAAFILPSDLTGSVAVNPSGWSFPLPNGINNNVNFVDNVGPPITQTVAQQTFRLLTPWQRPSSFDSSKQYLNDISGMGLFTSDLGANSPNDPNVILSEDFRGRCCSTKPKRFGDRYTSARAALAFLPVH